MKSIILNVPEYVYSFYQKVGIAAGGVNVEQVMADALYKLAGELSLNAIEKKAKEK